MDLINFRTITIDIGTANEPIPPVILSAGDHDGRIVKVRLFDGPSATSESGLGARLLYTTADGVGGYATMSTVTGEPTLAWSVPVPTEALAPGRRTMAVQITDGTRVVTTRTFDVIVEPYLIDEDSPEAQDALSEFRAAVEVLGGLTIPIPILKGGTGLTSSPSMLVNLGSTSAASVMQASPRPGVTGTLPVANGGSGATTAASAPWLQKSGGTMTGQIVGLTGTSGYINRSGTVQDATAAVTTNQAISFYHDYDGSNHRVGYSEITREPSGVYRSFVTTNPTAGKNFGIYFHVTDTGALTFNTSEGAASKAIAQGLGLDAPTVQTFYWSGGAYITNGQKQIVFSVPFRKPVNATGCTLTSVECIVRQNNDYRFGSSASVWVTPTTKQISNLYLDYGQAELMLDYPADSTTTNNDACGVRAKVTLTFTY